MHDRRIFVSPLYRAALVARLGCLPGTGAEPLPDTKGLQVYGVHIIENELMEPGADPVVQYADGSMGVLGGER